MNNKGQTLVLFVVLIPVLFIGILLFANYGKMANEKNKVKSSVIYSIRYGLNLIGKTEDDRVLSDLEIEERVSYILNQNLDSKYNKSVKVSNGEIYISVDYKFSDSINIGGINSFTCSMSGKVVEDNFYIEGC